MAVQKRGPEDDTCFPSGVVEKCQVSGALHSNQSPISAVWIYLVPPLLTGLWQLRSASGAHGEDQTNLRKQSKVASQLKAKYWRLVGREL